MIQGAEYDIRCLDREWGFRVRNIFDTSVAARFVGMQKHGLSFLSEALLGVHIPKDAHIQKADWSYRPLSQNALNYAAADVRYLLSIQKALEKGLRTLARSPWASEECTRLEEIRYVAPDPETAFLSLKGSGGFKWARKGNLKTTIQVTRSRGSASEPAPILCCATRNSDPFGIQSDCRSSPTFRHSRGKLTLVSAGFCVQLFRVDWPIHQSTIQSITAYNRHRFKSNVCRALRSGELAWESSCRSIHL